MKLPNWLLTIFLGKCTHKSFKVMYSEHYWNQMFEYRMCNRCGWEIKTDITEAYDSKKYVEPKSFYDTFYGDYWEYSCPTRGRIGRNSEWYRNNPKITPINIKTNSIKTCERSEP